MTYFQILDNKNECIGLFYDNELHFSNFCHDLTHTWSYHPNFNAEYAQLYVEGKNISQIAPSHLKTKWDKINSKKSALLNSFLLSKIDLNKHCFYDLVPTSFLKEYNLIKNEVTKYVFENYEKPKNYDFLLDMTKLCNKISMQPLNLDKKELLILKLKTKSQYNKYIDYNIFGSVTGRLTTRSNSFPIMTLNKKYRSMIKPHNNMFLELDMNAAEIRTFLALLGKEQPEIDIHDYNKQFIFGNLVDRKEAKTRFFSWFYNPNNSDKELEKVYDRDYLLQRYYDGKTVKSPFGRTIKTDDFHALNYLIQSAASDIILRNVLKLDKLLKDKKSFVSFMIHDSVVIDLHSDDIPLIKELYNLFTETEYGKFLASVSYGPNFGELREQN